MQQFNMYLKGKGYSKLTREKTITEVSHFSGWIEKEGMQAEEVRYGDILGYIEQLKRMANSQRTIQIKLQALKHYYRYLESQGVITTHPCQGIVIKGVRRKTLYMPLSLSDLETLYKQYKGHHPLTDKRNKVILGLLIYQGLRTEELAGLSMNDLNLREGKICIQSIQENSRP